MGLYVRFCRVVLEHSKHSPSTVCDADKSLISDELILSKNVLSYPLLSPPSLSASRSMYPTMRFCVKATRHPDSYERSLLYPTCALVFLALMSFFLPPTSLKDREDVTLTLILTAVALRLVMADYLPRVHYITRADRVMKKCFNLLFFLVLHHATVYTCLLPPTVTDTFIGHAPTSLTDSCVGLPTSFPFLVQPLFFFPEILYSVLSYTRPFLPSSSQLVTLLDAFSVFLVLQQLISCSLIMRRSDKLVISTTVQPNHLCLF